MATAATVSTIPVALNQPTGLWSRIVPPLRVHAYAVLRSILTSAGG
jgi:hypothetical protein